MSNVILSNWYLAERLFPDTSCSRKSFSRIVISPNVFFSNRRLAERHFPESSLSWTSFTRNCIERNEQHYQIETSISRISGEWCFGKTTFGWTTIRKNDVRLNNDSQKCRSALWSFANSTIRPCNDSVKWLSTIFCFGKITIRQNLISEKRGFDEMTFRENDLAPLILIIYPNKYVYNFK